MTATKTIPLFILLTAVDVIRCLRCGAEVTVGESKCLKGRRVCPGCYGPDPESVGQIIHIITGEDLIGCTSCPAEAPIGESGCIEGYRVCRGCFGPDLPGEFGEPPF
jgi:formylmethanofuran dehydrogenase subunit E